MDDLTPTIKAITVNAYDLYRRFGLIPDRETILRMLDEEVHELHAEVVFLNTYSPQPDDITDLADEVADVIYTAVAALLLLNYRDGLWEPDRMEAALARITQKIAANDAKNTTTHEVRDGKIRTKV